MAIASTNPTTGETLQEFGAIDSREVQENLAKADSAFRSYRNTSFVERATWLTATADLLENDKAHLARTMTVEMGKLLRAAEEEITKCARGCRFYAENAERFLAEQKVETESAHNFIRYEPMGPILAIMPWNFPFIVMPSADLGAAVKTGVAARIQNAGQSCIAAKRFILADKIYDGFMSEFVAKMRALKVGDPLDPETEIGPLASEAILEGVDEQVRKSVEAGAKLLTGGKRIDRGGFFYEPTVLAEIPAGSPADREGIFRPVACCFRARHAAGSITIANRRSCW